MVCDYFSVFYFVHLFAGIVCVFVYFSVLMVRRGCVYAHTHTPTHTKHTHAHAHTYIYIYLCLYIINFLSNKYWHNNSPFIKGYRITQCAGLAVVSKVISYISSYFVSYYNNINIFTLRAGHCAFESVGYSQAWASASEAAERSCARWAWHHCCYVQILSRYAFNIIHILI